MEIASRYARGRQHASLTLVAVYIVALLAACSSSESNEQLVQELALNSFCLGDVEPSGQIVQLAAGAPLVVHAIPDGCFSRSCTEIVVSECTIQGTNPFEVTGTIKVRELGGDRVCTADCGGAGTARCEGPTLQTGPHMVRMGDLSVTVDVPSELNQSEACAPPEAP